MHDDEAAPTTGPEDASTIEQPPPSVELRSGERIGNYIVRDRLGMGGFAIVYLADQVAPVRRRVALKIIKPGMDSREVIARFEGERQALALMDHPNVAKVFDAGAAEQGRPFFVMEHVAGVPITEHCDRQRATVDERLELFIDVCKAVQHAHQKGIIHRDLKPSNILVTLVDGRPVPKVIDFGVAKALHQQLSTHTVFTAQGQFIGTPEYMSPEQAEMTAQDIDTRTDIYSLGVVLYEILTGTLPFDPVTLRNGPPGEMQRRIREDDPPKPSTRLSGGDSSDAAVRRHVDPTTLVKELRGDLDWIVMKAMEKDRSRRYETANGLAADIRRHLDHEPVVAGPPSTLYRCRKFVRRHRAGVGVAVAAALMLIASTAVSLGFGLSEARQRRLAAEAAARAEAEQQVSKAVNDFLTEDLLSAVAPSSDPGQGREVRMIEVLDEAATRIDRAAGVGGRFADTPNVEASIRLTLGETYRLLGAFATAEPHLRRALDLCRETLGDDHPRTLDAMNQLAAALQSQGTFDEAERLLTTALETQRRVHGLEHEDAIATMSNLATLLRSENRLEEALPMQLELLETSREALGEEHHLTLTAMSGLGQLYVRSGEYDRAEPLLADVLEIQGRVLGEDDPATLVSVGLLAELYRRMDRADRAEPLLARTLETQTRLMGAEHQDTLTTAVNLANLRRRAGRLDEAETLMVPNLETCRETLGEEHPLTLNAMQLLSALYDDQGRLDEAEPLIREVMELRQRLLPADHPDILTSMSNLARLYMKKGEYGRARPLLTEAVAGSRRSLPGHWYQGIYLLRYGECLLGEQAFTDAEEALLESQKILAGALGDGHSRTLAATRVLVDLYVQWDRPAEAERWRR